MSPEQQEKGKIRQNGFYPSIEGLRSYAILMVILFHYFPQNKFCNYGWLGVDLFFVISGFLITTVLLKKENTKGFLKNFYIRRALKIFPVYYLLVICFLLFGKYLAPVFSQYPFYFQHQLLLWFPLQNFLMTFYESAVRDGIFNHFWSVSVEEQFYLLWPFIFVFLKSWKKRTIFITCIFVLNIIAVILLLAIFRNEPEKIYPNHIFRVDGLCIGVLAGLLNKEHHGAALKQLKKIITYLIILLAGLLLLKNFVFPQYLKEKGFLFYYIFVLSCSLLVVTGINEKQPLLYKAATTNAAARFLGKISYGLYMYHIPVYIFVNWANSSRQPGTTVASGDTVTALASFIITIAISTLSYYFFERKILSLKRYFQ